MHTESQKPVPEEIDDEDTIDESVEGEPEDIRDTEITSLLIREIKKRPSDTQIKAVNPTGPLGDTIWVPIPQQEDPKAR